jgi:hypothetical protein
MLPVYTAQSIIERDAIIAALTAQQIECISPERTISRKVTENTVDMAYGGYSAFFDGFQIMVAQKDAEKAKAIIQQIIQSAKEYESTAQRSTTEINKMSRGKWFWRAFLLIQLFVFLYYSIKQFFE